MIENENKKERAIEKQRFVEAVKNLVDIVKQRDPRYKKFKAQEQKASLGVKAGFSVITWNCLPAASKTYAYELMNVVLSPRSNRI